MGGLSQKQYQMIREALQETMDSLKAFTYDPPAPFKAKEEEGPSLISGIAVDYNIYNDYNDKCLPGCFDAWLASKEVAAIPLLFEHKEHLVAGEVNVFESRKEGLWIQAELHDTPVGRDMKRLIKAEVLDSLSVYYFYSMKLNPESITGRTEVKTIHKLNEISIVMQPAGHRTLLSTSKKTRKEIDKVEYLERLENLWKVKSDLEVEEIKEAVLAEWRKIYHEC